MTRHTIATIILLVLLSVATLGCGALGRDIAKLTGYSKSCVEGVSYLQFASGVTVQYAPDGKVVTCK